VGRQRRAEGFNPFGIGRRKHFFHPITPMVATSFHWPGRSAQILRRQSFALRQMVAVPSARFIL
jgi:hypothetical protein